MEPTISIANPLANYKAHKNEIDAAVDRVFSAGQYILGSEVSAFEKEFAQFVGVRFGIGVGSGTEALNVALRACKAAPGDEVITVSHTAVATVAAIELAGCRPVLVDIDPQSYTLDPDKIEAAISPRTRVILPVHLYGHPAEMQTICSLARTHGLYVIEDCAQSHGAIYQERKTGAWGDIAAFSFYPTKNLGACGDAGMIVTDNSELAERARLLREYGWRQRNSSEIPGLNSRLDELQAAILRVKLPHLKAENARRQALAGIYHEALSSTRLGLPACAAGSSHVYHQYVVRTPGRDNLREFLSGKGIQTSIHYPLPVHLQPAYQGRLKCSGSMANSETATREILSLPVCPELSNEQINRVAAAIISWDRDKPS